MIHPTEKDYEPKPFRQLQSGAQDQLSLKMKVDSANQLPGELFGPKINGIMQNVIKNSRKEIVCGHT